MNDPAISARASPSEAMVSDQAAAFEDFFPRPSLRLGG
jgi:hypothetical protein